jgi:large subunit ribosomal protein L10
MNRKQKQATIEKLKQAFSTATIAIVAQNKGITASQAIKIRKDISIAGGETLVAKNTLTKLGVQSSQYEPITNLLKGPIVLMYSSGDPIAIAKIAMDFAKDNNTLEVTGGSMGSNFLDMTSLKALADLPPLDQLRGMLIGIIQGPASKVARVINAPGTQIARVVKAYSEK